MNEESRGWEENRRTLLQYILTCQNSKLGRQHTKAPLAAALSPFMSLLYPPNPWREWCDVWRLSTTPGFTSPTLFEQWCGSFYVPQEPDKGKCCETGPTVFRCSSEKKRISKYLQMSLQRQHFLRSYLKTLTGALPTGPTRRRFLGQVSRSLISLPVIMSIAIFWGVGGGEFFKSVWFWAIWRALRKFDD